MNSIDPIQVITTVAGFVPWLLTLIAAVCAIVGLILIATGLLALREINDGQSQRTLVSCSLEVFYGAGLIMITSIIALVGKGVTNMAPANASAMLYDVQASGAIDKISLAAFLTLVQAAGFIAVIVGWGQLRRLSTGRLRPGESIAWPSAFVFLLGGLACIYVHWSIGFLGALMGIPMAQWLNAI